MPLFVTYIIYTTVLWAILIAVVPRKDLRELAIYGVLFGGLADGIIIVIATFWLGLGGYINMGPLGFRGMPFFPLIAWSAYFVLYFYFLPGYRPFRYLYMFSAISMSLLFSNVLMNLGIFRWNHGRILIPFVLYTIWICSATWAYGKLRKLERRRQEE